MVKNMYLIRTANYERNNRISVGHMKKMEYITSITIYQQITKKYGCLHNGSIPVFFFQFDLMYFFSSSSLSCNISRFWSMPSNMVTSISRICRSHKVGQTHLWCIKPQKTVTLEKESHVFWSLVDTRWIASHFCRIMFHKISHVLILYNFIHDIYNGFKIICIHIVTITLSQRTMDCPI